MRTESGARAWLVALLALCACASPGPPLPITPHLDWPLPEPLAEAFGADGTPPLPRLGVARFDDARSEALRHASSPPLHFGGLALVRQGDVRTGDASFAGAPASGLERDAVATLARSGDFSEVESVTLSPAELTPAQRAAALREAGVSWVLEATLEEFSGIQAQSFTLTPLRVGWMRNRYDTPFGRVAASYRLWGAEGVVWSTRVAVEHHSPGVSILQAALDAMGHANETLAQRLHAFVAGDRLREARVVPLRVMDGCGIGPRRAAKLVAEVSQVYGREIGLLFRPEYETWTPPEAPWHPAPLLDALSQRPPPYGGFVLGVAPFGRETSRALPDDRYGLANAFGRHAVAGCDEAGQVRALTVIHEIGHLLGAVHVMQRSSIMHPVAEFDARFFDPLNRRILRTARDRHFARVLPDATVRRLRAIYRAASRFPDEVEAHDLEIAQTALERAAGVEVGE